MSHVFLLGVEGGGRAYLWYFMVLQQLLTIVDFCQLGEGLQVDLY